MSPSRVAAAALSSLLLASTALPSMAAVHRVKMVKRSDEEFVRDKMAHAAAQKLQQEGGDQHQQHHGDHNHHGDHHRHDHHQDGYERT